MANETVAETAKISAEPEDASPSPVSGNLDRAHAQVPVICKDCDKEFTVPYRHFQVGVVFHCPHCHGSFVPRLAIYHAVRDRVEAFFEKRGREAEQLAANPADAAVLQQRQAAALAELHRGLLELARSIRPAGKLVRRRGFGAMFT